MSIDFRCRCGETIQVDDEYAGVRVRCPYCNDLITAPARGPAVASRPMTASRPRSADGEDDRPGRRGRDGDDIFDDRPSRRRVRDEDDDRPSRRRSYDDEDDRPTRRRREDKPTAQTFEGKVLNGGVIGGLLTMVISGGLFVGLLFVDIIWFWLPILFVFGLIGFLKGLFVRGD